MTQQESTEEHSYVLEKLARILAEMQAMPGPDEVNKDDLSEWMEARQNLRYKLDSAMTTASLALPDNVTKALEAVEACYYAKPGILPGKESKG